MKVNKSLLISLFSKAKRSLFLSLFYEDKIARFLPAFVSLEVERGCCLQCSHCDLWKRKNKRRQMSLQQMKKVVLDLKQWLGEFQLNLTGGEPFLNKDTVALIEFIQKQGIEIYLNSNGYLLTEEKIKKIARTGVYGLSISLDSLKPETYNRLRGKPRAWERAVRVLELLKKYCQDRTYLTVTTIIMDQNLDELAEMVYWTKKQGLDAIIFQPLWQNFGQDYNKDWFTKSNFWIKDAAKAEAVLDQLIALKKQGLPVGNRVSDLEKYKRYFRDPVAFGGSQVCRVGVNNFNIDIYGDVRLCYNLSPIGNILQERPEKIWNGKRAQKQRAQILNCQRGCKVLLCNSHDTGSAIRSLGHQIKEAFMR
jgi:MoaA/NifB/PqqE/SkfB family radical SAM enzyme